MRGLILNKLACCFTGHRLISARDTIPLHELLLHELDGLIQEGCRDFYAGGALGFDTLAAQAVLERRAENPTLRLHLILPCQNQHARWNPCQRDVYERILEQADSAEYIAEQYAPQNMHIRNRRLVDASGVCLCYLRQYNSGTGGTVAYARRRKLRIRNLALLLTQPEDF